MKTIEITIELIVMIQVRLLVKQHVLPILQYRDI